MAGSRWLVVLTGDLAVRKPLVDCSYERRRWVLQRAAEIISKAAASPVNLKKQKRRKVRFHRELCALDGRLQSDRLSDSNLPFL